MKTLPCSLCLAALGSLLAVAQSPVPPAAPMPAPQPVAQSTERTTQQIARADQLYQSALSDADSARWDASLAKLNQLLEQYDSSDYHADAAQYWQAYAESKLGQDSQALQSLAALEKEHPDSTWEPDAKALALELRQANGESVSPATQSNDDLKLLAINGLMQTDSAQALPLLQKVVNGSSSPAVKSRALFVMAQSHAPAAITELEQVAETGAAQPAGSPANDLSVEAVRYLGLMGGASGRDALAKIYTESSSPALKQSIIRSFGISGDMDHLIPLAKTEKDPALRASAIRALGLSGSPAAQAALAGMYTGASDRETSKAVIQALFIHNDAAGLVSLARKETDPELKRDIVQRLSMMRNPAATAYLIEILGQ